jgi:hypothetical protein
MTYKENLQKQLLLQRLLEVLTVGPLLAVNSEFPSHGTLEVSLVLLVGKVESLELVRLPCMVSSCCIWND